MKTALFGMGRFWSAERLEAPEFHYAETPEQQYLTRNPSGYRGLEGTGVSRTRRAAGRSLDRAPGSH